MEQSFGKKYMKYFAFFLCFYISQATAQKFEYKSDFNSPSLEIVTFSTGDTIKVEKKDTKTMLTSLEVLDKNKKIIYGIKKISDAHVHIKAAYPDFKKAQVAVVETNCGGNSCGSEGVYVVYTFENKLHIDFIGDAYRRDFLLRIDITNNSNPKITATNVLENKFDKYGDMIKGTRELINGKGSIASTFNRDWLKFVGEHPERYFEDKLRREPLAQKINYENFRELRNFMSGPGGTSIQDGKYLIMTGCKAHMCPDYYAAILVDVVNSKEWALWVDSGKKIIKFGTTDKWSDEIAYKLISEINDGNSFKITYSNSKFFERIKK
jgi:hypothetical protein